MAGFKTHITVSSTLGIGYGAAAHVMYDVPISTSCLAGGLCSVSGMLPDLDSDSGTPLRETLAFAAAIVPMLVLPRFAQMGFDHDSMAVVTMLIYLAIRLPVAHVIRKTTAHRGMFHSLPACAIFGELTFLLCAGNDFETRVFKAAAVVVGFMSHLILDEIWSVDFHYGIPRLKSSFGTAIKFVGDKPIPNLFSWGLLGLLTFLSIDGRIYEGDVAPYVRALQMGHATVVSTPTTEEEDRVLELRPEVDAAMRSESPWNR